MRNVHHGVFMSKLQVGGSTFFQMVCGERPTSLEKPVKEWIKTALPHEVDHGAYRKNKKRVQNGEERKPRTDELPGADMEQSLPEGAGTVRKGILVQQIHAKTRRRDNIDCSGMEFRHGAKYLE